VTNPAQAEVEVFDRCDAILGEGPTWDPVSERLVWVDVLAGAVHETSPDGNRVADWSLPGHVGAALPAAEGGLLVCLPDRIAVLATDGTIGDVVALEAHLPTNRANDAKCDPTGRAWIGTMSYDETRAEGSLYRLDPGPTLNPVLGELGIANGLGWSRDGTTMYFIDTPTQQVRAFPFDPDSGWMGEGRAVVTVDKGDGYPDGMCTDDEGCLWVALFAGGRVQRYTPDGRLDRTILVPATYTTSCCFGGPGRDQLFVTTARRDLGDDPSREPLAGSVFVAEPGVTGPPATPWKRPVP
jgi:sugar lactone lactonase YvrE